MKKKIFRSICLVTTTVLLVSAILIMALTYDHFQGVQQNQLKMQTELAANGVVHNGVSFFENFDTNEYRITLIDADGGVLYDNKTDEGSMENHLEREEVKEAIESGYGESIRYSDTIMEELLYSAKLLPDGGVIRLSISQSSIFNILLGVLPSIILIIIAAVIISFILADRLSKNIVKPLNELNLDDPLSNEGYDELSPVLSRIKMQQKELVWQAEALARKQDEFDAVANNMSEGLVLLNEKAEIISINRAAKHIFGTDYRAVGKSIVSVNRAPEICEMLKHVQAGQHSEDRITIATRTYQIDMTPIYSKYGKISGIALLVFDITEKVQSEQLRREFTANVSHELKTPLHTISGCAEMLKSGIVKPEDTAHFTERIYSEAHRMIQLVEDIINLSHLDEGEQNIIAEEIDLCAIAESAVHNFEQSAESAGVSIEFKGTSVKVKAIPRLVDEIVSNLIDNAIKYNRADGKVFVEVSEKNGFAELMVRDTGIGIAPEHQERVFERFYRVDKSRSKEVGGTGLGLSIVKNAAKIHDAKIGIESKMGEGTTITVRFPK